jgi:hypothetical protein
MFVDKVCLVLGISDLNLIYPIDYWLVRASNSSDTPRSRGLPLRPNRPQEKPTKPTRAQTVSCKTRPTKDAV